MFLFQAVNMFSICTDWKIKKAQLKKAKEKYKNTLKYLCIRKILATYERDMFGLHEDGNKVTNKLVEVASYFKMLGPEVSTHIFHDIFERANRRSFKYLKFLQYLAWNVRSVDFSVKDSFPEKFDFIFDYRTDLHLHYKITYRLMNWVLTNCSNLSEISFLGEFDCARDVFDEKLFTAIMKKHGHQLKAIELDYRMFNKRPNMLSAIGKNCDKLMKLTIWNLFFGVYKPEYSNWAVNCSKEVSSQLSLKTEYKQKISNIDSKCSLKYINQVFFDSEKDLSYSFCKTLKILSFPRLNFDGQSYYLLVQNMLYFYAPNLEYTNLPLKLVDSLVFLSIIENNDVSLKLRKFTEFSANCNKTYKTVEKLVKRLPFLEEAEINLVSLKDKQKKTIIYHMNPKLTNLKISLDPPASSLFYVGRRFEYLQNLEVYFTCLDSHSGDSKYFKQAHCRDFFMFRHLKSFKFSCVVSPNIQILNTIIHILKSCQDTLTNFEIEGYDNANIKQIIDLICCESFSLNDITFSFISSLTYEHVMTMVKLFIDKQVSLNVENCSEISLDELLAVKGYLVYNNVKKLFKFNFKHDGSTY